MQTSNYDIAGTNPNAVSIAAYSKAGYKGIEYKELAPPYWLVKKYKNDWDWTAYKKIYQREILDKLDPYQVFADLGANAILLCYEEPGHPCHRRLVAEWLGLHLGVAINEYESQS